MKVNFPENELVYQNLRFSRMTYNFEHHHGQLREEVKTDALGQAQARHEAHLRQAANMELGRGQNITAIA
jgi:hypothetical protein